MLVAFVLLLIHSLYKIEYADGGGLVTSQVAALINLYNSTNGPAWQWANKEHSWAIVNSNNTYKATTDPCSGAWEGVTCKVSLDDDGEQYYISQLNLTEHGLAGSLPTELFNDLATIEIMLLGSNILTGAIPEVLVNNNELINSFSL